MCRSREAFTASRGANCEKGCPRRKVPKQVNEKAFTRIEYLFHVERRSGPILESDVSGRM